MYHLTSSMSDRINFDEMARTAAVIMLQTGLTDEEALEQDPQQYAEFSWDEWLNVEDEVDDIEEAKARYISAFAQSVKDWQRQKRIDNLDQELYLKKTGHTTALTVFPGGKKDGLDYGPVVVEITVLDLDGSTIAYRISTDSQDDDWQIGHTEDAVDALVDYREQAKDTEQMMEELDYA